MNAQHLIGCLTAALLLTPASALVVRAQGGQHASHGNGGTKGPLPDSVRQAAAGPQNAFEIWTTR